MVGGRGRDLGGPVSPACTSNHFGRAVRGRIRVFESVSRRSISSLELESACRVPRLSAPEFTSALASPAPSRSRPLTGLLRPPSPAFSRLQMPHPSRRITSPIVHTHSLPFPPSFDHFSSLTHSAQPMPTPLSSHRGGRGRQWRSVVSRFPPGIATSYPRTQSPGVNPGVGEARLLPRARSDWGSYGLALSTSAAEARLISPSLSCPRAHLKSALTRTSSARQFRRDARRRRQGTGGSLGHVTWTYLDIEEGLKAAGLSQ